MNTKCPQCGSPYNITEAHVGRKFTCKKCSTPLAVGPSGLEYQDAPAAPAAPAQSFSFTDAAASGGGRAAARARDDWDDGDDYQDDDRPARRSRSRSGGGGLGDFLSFRKMIVPVVIQIIFWIFTGLAVLGGLIVAGLAIASGHGTAIMIGLAELFIGVPIVVFLIRMYCELLIVVFRINDTLTDIKNVLERQSR